MQRQEELCTQWITKINQTTADYKKIRDFIKNQLKKFSFDSMESVRIRKDLLDLLDYIQLQEQDLRDLNALLKNTKIPFHPNENEIDAFDKKMLSLNAQISQINMRTENLTTLQAYNFAKPFVAQKANDDAIISSEEKESTDLTLKLNEVVKSNRKRMNLETWIVSGLVGLFIAFSVPFAGLPAVAGIALGLAVWAVSTVIIHKAMNLHLLYPHKKSNPQTEFHMFQPNDEDVRKSSHHNIFQRLGLSKEKKWEHAEEAAQPSNILPPATAPVYPTVVPEKIYPGRDLKL